MHNETKEISPEIAVQRGIFGLLHGVAKPWFTYYDYYYHARFGPYETDRRIIVYGADGKMYTVKALGEGLGFKVISGDGRRSL